MRTKVGEGDSGKDGGWFVSGRNLGIQVIVEQGSEGQKGLSNTDPSVLQLGLYLLPACKEQKLQSKR